jgi:hypothetical protein
VSFLQVEQSVELAWVERAFVDPAFVYASEERLAAAVQAVQA